MQAEEAQQDLLKSVLVEILDTPIDCNSIRNAQEQENIFERAALLDPAQEQACKRHWGLHC